MVHTLTTPAVAPGGSPVRPRSILAVASPAPDGWESGGIQTSRTCADPIIRDKCVTLPPPGDPTARPTLAEFPAFLIEQGSNCSTLSGEDRQREASEALTASTDYALGVTLRTGEANVGAPSLADARDLGELPSVAAALAALECAAANDGHGAEWTIHADVGAATYLAQAGLIDAAGVIGSGAPLIVSAGYACEDAPGAFRMWATGRVWAGVGAITTREAINRRTNNREAWADRAAVVGFNTCINLTASFPPPGAEVTP